MKLVIAAIVTFATCLVLASCGGSSGSAPNPIPATSAPTGLSYPTPQTLTLDKSVTPVNPTVTNSPTSYSVSPALPAGLTLNTATGVITGTPTAITARATYTVTATNAGGSATTSLVIAVSDVAPTVAYSGGRVALAVGLPTATLTPSSSGGTAVSWSVSPALPAGLAFSTTDGIITGTPTATAAAQVYTVTAANSGGNGTFALNLSVETGTLLDLGHNASVDLLRFDGTRVLSLDHNGHWVLWDYATAANVANGTTGCFEANTCYGDPQADMAGSVFVVQTLGNFESHATTDGHLLGTIPISIAGDSHFFWWKLAADGSYFVAGGSQRLEGWTPAGLALFSIEGNYAAAVAFAAPGQVRLTAGPTSSHAIETIDVTAGTSTVSADYNGSFVRWFADGSRFLSSTSGTLLTYSKDVVQQDATILADQGILGGTHNFFWNSHSTTLDIYQVGASGRLKASFTGVETGPIVSGSTLGLFTGGQLSVVDLSVATPVKTDHTLPAAGAGSGPDVYAATDAAHWMIGNDGGIVADGAPATPRLFNYGKALSVAGSSSRFAVSVASGQILYFDSTSLAQQDTIQKSASKLQLSADGTVLAALGDPLVIYSLPAKTVLKTWGGATDITLSDTGTVLGQVLFGMGGIEHEVSSVDGSTVIWTDQLQAGPIALAPGGNPIAISQGNAPPLFGPQIPATQSINNGALVTAFSGFPVGWLDGQRLLLNNYQIMNHVGAAFAGATIVSPTGAKLADSPLPELASFQLLGADSIYAPELNEIVAPTTGVVSWKSGDTASAKIGAVAGSHVVFVSGARVVALSQ